jgi:PIN domain nuclease of toxin-antitoxin system
MSAGNGSTEERWLLDASAVLALIGREPGAEIVVPILSRSAITAVNLAEVVKKLREQGYRSEEAKATVMALRIPLERGPVDFQQAIQLGDLAFLGRTYGLSMGDSMCLLVAGWSGRTAVTAERRWKEIPSESLPGVKILTIR